MKYKWGKNPQPVQLLVQPLLMPRLARAGGGLWSSCSMYWGCEPACAHKYTHRSCTKCAVKVKLFITSRLHPQVIQEGHAGPAWSQKGSLDQSRALVWALPIRPAVSFLRDAMLFPAPSIPTFYKPGSFNKPAFSWAHLAAEKGCQAGRSLAWAFAGALQDLASVYALTSVGESDVPVVGVLTANTVPCRRRR